MMLHDVLNLLNLADSVDQTTIQRLIIAPPYSASGVTPTGESVVYPDCTKITPLLAQMFGLGNNARCNIQAKCNNNTSSLASASQPSAKPKAIPVAST